MLAPTVYDSSVNLLADKASMDEVKLMKLRYAGACKACGASVAAGDRGAYYKTGRYVLCVPCYESGGDETVENSAETPTIEPASYVHGTAGAAAWQEHKRRKAHDEARVMENHPRLGKMLLALRSEPQHVQAWETGAKGEETLGRVLNRAASERLVVLHDRRVPKSRANIDHMVLTAEALWIIDAKKYTGKPELRRSGGLFSAKTEDLFVNGRNQTKLVDGVQRQMALAEDLCSLSVPVRGALCFINADWPLIGGNFTVRGIEALWPRRMVKLLQAEAQAGPVNEDDLESLLRVFKAYT